MANLVQWRKHGLCNWANLFVWQLCPALAFPLSLFMNLLCLGLEGAMVAMTVVLGAACGVSHCSKSTFPKIGQVIFLFFNFNRRRNSSL